MKKEIRKKVLHDLKTLSQQPDEKNQIEKSMLNKLFETKSWQEASVIGTTLSMNKEFNTEPLIKQAIKEGKTICVPRTFGLGKMDFYYYDLEEPLEETKFGVLEPTNNHQFEKNKIDLLIVPGVAFSKEGYRVGFGGGFYDRYLSDFKGETYSLVFKEQMGYIWEPSQYDIPVKNMITEKLVGGSR
ncbi:MULTISPECIES: 5-formyltetrahydrofolate cyclo-ligase [Vagococcus]|uniref:5-formyltetrahydrofolate cyclo-ligase n=1 Tax=Vagococcus fluvialis bH819 TaxID=1255619 RepID=A0A1X6WR00_9ENTE|nr:MULTISPECIES: 5-formyltetrahydrofolate cyclo-ligase [Vagococcus]SLM86678.1 5-formyltetrahydrofolate cyclo-ligase [Vagococcus fluvialis bH819]